MSTYYLYPRLSALYNKRISAFCEPLFSFFNLNQFYYLKITNCGFCYYIDSHIPFTEYWTSEETYLNYPFYRHPRFFDPGVSVLTTSQDERLEEMISSLKDLFQFESWLRIVNKLPDGIEEFGFSSPSASSMQVNTLLREAPLFQLFLKHFKQNHRDILQEFEKNQTNLVEILGSNFYKTPPPVPTKASQRMALLEELGFGADIHLTEKEIQIMKLILQGLSSSETGQHLFLSKRTIEHRIERMKEKLSCYSKSELIQKARELEFLGYF